MKNLSMMYKIATCFALICLFSIAFAGENGKKTPKKSDNDKSEFVIQTEQFADLRILRYQVNGFEDLSLDEKKLLYYLYKASLSGRDIIYDQNYKHNLYIRRTLEAIVNHYTGDRKSDEFADFMVYVKRVWFSNGIHHHYSTQKIMPDFTYQYFEELLKNTPWDLPISDGQLYHEILQKLQPIMFDPEVDSKRVNLDEHADNIAESANNYYEGVVFEETMDFYGNMKNEDDPRPISYGLNSKLVKEDGKVFEKIWKVGGMYSSAIEQIVYWLEMAITVAETPEQKTALTLLVDYYRTGDLRTFDEYSIAWVNDTESRIDIINGFIEVYGDAIGYRGAYESVVHMKDMEATKTIKIISDNAQWFEDNSPILDEHKKAEVKGITAKVVTVVIESGDAAPATPIGINLPNSNWIRKEHGSKSVTIGNIIFAYNSVSSGDGMLDEFAYDEEEIRIAEEYGGLAGELMVDMHEVIGHASGQINDGVGTPKETLKNYSSTLEEARADLVALYFIMDQKLIDIGVMPNMDVAKTAYNGYIRNGMMLQLKRIKLMDHIEESHMRNRQMIARWVFQKGMNEDVISRVNEKGKTYFVINDYMKLRELFGQLLREVQRIKSEGDFEAGKNLVETYGVLVEYTMHKELLERFEGLNIAPYSGFINPKITAEMDGDEIVDVKIEYPIDFTEQMLHYAKNYSFLPSYN